MEPTENTSIVAAEPLSEVAPFEIPDFLGDGESVEIDRPEKDEYH